MGSTGKSVSSTWSASLAMASHSSGVTSPPRTLPLKAAAPAEPAGTHGTFAGAGPAAPRPVPGMRGQARAPPPGAAPPPPVAALAFAAALLPRPRLRRLPAPFCCAGIPGASCGSCATFPCGCWIRARPDCWNKLFVVSRDCEIRNSGNTWESPGAFPTCKSEYIIESPVCK